MSAQFRLSLAEADAEAIHRIHAAKACGQWWLDLGDLPIERVPDEIAELADQLRVLTLGKYRLSVVGELYDWGWDGHRPRTVRHLEPLGGLANLANLDLSGCARLTDLEPLRGHANLAALNLSECEQLTDLEPLGGLANLAALNLSECKQLTTLEPLRGIANLAKLDLFGCDKLTDFEPLRGIANLATLNLSKCEQLTTLEPLRSLANLASLDLSGCDKLTDFEPLRSLANLANLDLSGCENLTSLEPLRGLVDLTTLSLHRCGKLTDLEPLRGLANLATLDLGGCDRLTTLEPLRGLANLTTLDLSYSRWLRTLEPLHGLVKLASLNLTGCWNLTSLEPLRELANLTTLDLCWCEKLTSLEPLRGLANLATLDLGECDRLTTLEPLRGLANLATLTLNKCRADSFAPVRGLLNTLDTLRVHDARFADLHSSVCREFSGDEHLTAIRAYYAALGSDAMPDAEIRVFVLGNARCGKSSLIRRLAGMTWEEIEALEMGTNHSATIVACPAPAEWNLPHPVTLSIWDFGGQDIHHGAQALFLREPAIYLVLYADATENEDTILDGGFAIRNRRLEHWFGCIPDNFERWGVVTCPVLFVHAQCDRSAEVAQPPFHPQQELFPNLSPLIHASAKADGGLDLLLPHLEKAVKDLLKEYPQAPLPASWAKVRERLREMQTSRSPRTMTLADFQNLCDECGCNPGDDVLLRRALDQMGVVYHREGVFDNRIIVDPAWALDPIYTLFQPDHERQQEIDEHHGWFTRKDLGDYFWDQHHYSVADQRTFLDFMQRCGICFPTQTGWGNAYQGHYIILDKLQPLSEEESLWFEYTLNSAREVVTATVRFPFLQERIARVFLSSGCGLGECVSCWRYGCHAVDAGAGSEALVRIDGHAIRIQTWGEKAEEMAETLLLMLDRYPHAQWPEVTWAKTMGRPTAPDSDDSDGKPERQIDPDLPAGQ